MRTREIIRRIRQQCEGEENFHPEILGRIERAIKEDPQRGRAWYEMMIAWNSLQAADPVLVNQFLESIWARSKRRRAYRKSFREVGMDPVTMKVIDKKRYRRWCKKLEKAERASGD